MFLQERTLGLGAAALMLLGTAHFSHSDAQTVHKYVVRSSDTLYKIATAKGISLSALEAVNPQIKNVNDVWAGETIHLPTPRMFAAPPHGQFVTPNGILSTAKSFLGTPYVWGGENPRGGFDCSGFVQYVFGRHGIHLPRQSHSQATVGAVVPRNQLKPGDLLFFSNTDSYAKDYANHVTHVGIYMGNDAMIESSSAHHDIGVTIVHHVFANPFYRAHFYGARDVLHRSRP